MYNGKKIIAIIPARGGSKGLPYKNIKNMNGKPLIAWTIESALSSKLLDRIFVSTDDKEIRDVSVKIGLDIPFMRPSKFAQDSSPTWELVIHALDKFKKLGEDFDYIALLEPTSPLRKKNDIDNAIKILLDNFKDDTLVSVGEIHTEHPKIVKKLDSKGYVKQYINSKNQFYQRQQFDKAYFPYGVIYLSKVDTFYVQKKFYTDKTIPYEIERWQNYEIDDFLDFKIIEEIIKNKEVFNG
jgi:CMP-N-acetylneuraminic acid synthetase